MRLFASSLRSCDSLVYGCVNTTSLLAVYHVAAKVCTSLPRTCANITEAPVPMQVMSLEYAG